jgi:adenylylsulfate kinase-like enzyme
MPLINQQEVYAQCGLKIKQDLMEGNAVVLFAYGLSGSGKTFTVFG